MFKRLQNLWAWSKIDPNQPSKMEKDVFVWTGWANRKKMATIIDLEEKPKFDLKDEQL